MEELKNRMKVIRVKKNDLDIIMILLPIILIVQTEGKKSLR